MKFNSSKPIILSIQVRIEQEGSPGVETSTFNVSLGEQNLFVCLIKFFAIFIPLFKVRNLRVLVEALA